MLPLSVSCCLALLLSALFDCVSLSACWQVHKKTPVLCKLNKYCAISYEMQRKILANFCCEMRRDAMSREKLATIGHTRKVRKAGDNCRQHLLKIVLLSRVCVGEIALAARHKKYFARQSTIAIAQLKRIFIDSLQGQKEIGRRERKGERRRTGCSLVSCLAYPAADNIQHLHDKQLSSAQT